MKKTLIRNEQEYREFAFNIVKKNEGNHVPDALGVSLDWECYDSNENGEPIDEAGNVLPEHGPDTLELCDEIKNMEYPVLVLTIICKDFDRTGSFEICVVEYVHLSDFK